MKVHALPEPEDDQTLSISVRIDQPLIGVLMADGEQTTVRYFVDEGAAEIGSLSTGVQKALSLLGAWSDLDWDQALDALDRIRHQSQPTPPIGP